MDADVFQRRELSSGRLQRGPHRSGEDQKYTLKTDFRYKATIADVQLNLKWGGVINEAVRNIDRRTAGYTYLGSDLLANSGDESAALFTEKVYNQDFPFGTNVQGFPNIDRWALAREFGAHPERFVGPTAATRLTDALRNHWDTKEQIDALYVQPIVNVTRKLSIAPGVRWERTRGISRGNNDIGNRATQKALTGSETPVVPVSTTDLTYIQTRYGSDDVSKTNYNTWLKYLHTNYRATESLTFRLSYNEAITRPDLQDLAGGISINDTATPQIGTVPNPDLKPERSRNVSFSTEYYFPRGGGFLTGSFTRRDIKELIRTTSEFIAVDGSFAGDPDFAGFQINTKDNVAKAHVSVAELNYTQSMAFLAERGFGGEKVGSFLRRASIFANYTHLMYDNYENFRRPTKLANGGLNVGVGPVDFRWSVNWTPLFRRNLAANGWSNLDDERIIHGFEANWRLRSNKVIFLTGRNVFNEPTRTLYGNPNVNILNRYFESGSFWSLGFKATY